MPPTADQQFGDAAYVMQLALLLLLDAIALTQPATAHALIDEIGKLLHEPLPTPGITHGLQAIRRQVEALARQRGADH